MASSWLRTSHHQSRLLGSDILTAGNRCEKPMSLASWSVAALSSSGIYKDSHFGARHHAVKLPIERNQWLLHLVALKSDMKIFSLFFAVLLLMLQGALGFMRAPNNDVQCKQAGGTCSPDHCPLPNMRSFGRCQQGVPCCRTVYD